jgi:hypothetical protein
MEAMALTAFAGREFMTSEIKTSELRDLFPKVNFGDPVAVAKATETTLSGLWDAEKTGDHERKRSLSKLAAALAKKLSRLLW